VRRDVQSSRKLFTTIVECDRLHCAEQFRSSSLPRVVDAQLGAAGWTILELADPRTGERGKRYLCPEHKPPPRMSAGGSGFADVAYAQRGRSTSH
jgi:hypothetical protein